MNQETGSGWGFWVFAGGLSAVAVAGAWWAFRTPDYEIRAKHRDALIEARKTGKAMLLACPICGDAVSSAAAECPHCGNPQG